MTIRPPFLLNGFAKEDSWNAQPQKKNNVKFPRYHPPPRIYGKSLKFFADITQPARTAMPEKSGKSFFFFSNCLGDWMRKMKGTIEARVTLRRIVMTIVIDIVIANQDASFVLGLIRLGKIYNRNR